MIHQDALIVQHAHVQQALFIQYLCMSSFQLKQILYILLVLKAMYQTSSKSLHLCLQCLAVEAKNPYTYTHMCSYTQRTFKSREWDSNWLANSCFHCAKEEKKKTSLDYTKSNLACTEFLLVSGFKATLVFRPVAFELTSHGQNVSVDQNTVQWHTVQYCQHQTEMTRSVFHVVLDQ